MNVAFLVISLAALAVLTVTSPEAVFPTMIQGAESAIKLVVELLAIYCVWLSVLKMMEKTGVDKLIAKLLRPVTKRLFKNESEDAYVAISVNFAANLLGMGGAATPAGIKAMELMHKGGETATPNMIMLLVIASTSLQIIPATVIALRANAGSAAAADIFVPTLISSASSTAIGMILCRVFGSKDSQKVETEKYSKIGRGSRSAKKAESATKALE